MKSVFTIVSLVLLMSCGNTSNGASCSETNTSGAPDSIIQNGSITTYTWGNCTKVYPTNLTPIPTSSKNVPLITSNSANKQRIGVYTNVSSLHAIQFNIHGIAFNPEQTTTISYNNTSLLGINANKEFPAIVIANVGNFEKDQPLLILEGDIVGDIFADSVYMVDGNYKSLPYTLEFKKLDE